jgi:hypothetical protein
VRRDAATQIDPLDLPEFAIRQNGGELQGLIEGGRDAGGFKIVESEPAGSAGTVRSHRAAQRELCDPRH